VLPSPPRREPAPEKTSKKGDAAAVTPTVCPFCGSGKISVPAKRVDAHTYWRCEACNQMWNVSRHKAQSSGPYDGRWKY
jgi:transposase-like protein